MTFGLPRFSRRDGRAPPSNQRLALDYAACLDPQYATEFENALSVTWIVPCSYSRDKSASTSRSACSQSSSALPCSPPRAS